MARWFILLLSVLLLGGAPVIGQLIPGIGYPGGGYPGRRYPQGNPGPRRQPDSSSSAFIGMLRKIGDNSIVVEGDDGNITTISISGSTKYSDVSGKSAKIGDFQPGDHVNVSAHEDSKKAYRAASMMMVREGTPDEHSDASLAMNDTTRPIMHSSSSASASSSDTSTSPSSNSASSSSASDDDHPRLRRAASASDNTPSPIAQATPPDSATVAPPRSVPRVSAPQDSDSSDQPVLRRSSPAASTPSADSASSATARPSLHADDGNTVSRMPQQRMPESGDPFIDQTREATFQFNETLPNYVVKQFTTRYVSAASRRGGASWQALDNVTADVIEEDGTEKYKNILVNGKPPVRDVEKTGSWSKGEFSSMQNDVLSPYTNAEFTGKKASTIVNHPAFRYDFSVEQPNSHWHVEVESQVYMPGYTGTIWIDKENFRVLRIEMAARDMPRSFPLDQIEWAVDYDYVLIGEGKYLLPVHSESLSCARSSSQCTRNVIEFRNYRKFTADTSITFEPQE